MLACIVVTGGSAVGITAPSGWTQITRTDNDVNVTLVTYWKVASASEPSNYSWVLNTQTRAVGGITRYSGVATTNPIDVSSGNIGFGISATTTAVTTSAPNEEVVAVYGTDVNKMFGAPTGMTQEYNQSHTSLGPTIAANDTLQVSAGNSGINTSSIDLHKSRYWVSQQIALRRVSPISFDSSSFGSEQTYVTSGTWSHTVSGNNRLLIACAASYQSDFSGATYDGASMTLLEDEYVTGYDAAPYHYIACWGLLNPDVGTHNILVNFVGTAAWIVGAAESFDGVSQIGFPDAVMTNQETGSTYTGTLTTTAANTWGLLYTINKIGPTSAGVGTVIRQSEQGGGTAIGDSNGSWSTPGSNSLSMTAASSGPWGGIMISFAPAN
jgi:hypothetical protein